MFRFSSHAIAESLLYFPGISVAEFAGEAGFVQAITLPSHNKRIVHLQSFHNYNLERLYFHTYRLNCVVEFAGEAGSVQGINYPPTTKRIVHVQSFHNYNLERLFLHTYRLSGVAEFAGEAGSVQALNYPLTTCVSHLHTNSLANKLPS